MRERLRTTLGVLELDEKPVGARTWITLPLLAVVGPREQARLRVE